MSIVSLHNYILRNLRNFLTLCIIVSLFLNRNGFTPGLAVANIQISSQTCFLDPRICLNKAIGGLASKYSLPLPIGEDCNSHDPLFYRDFKLFLKKRSRINRYNKEVELFRRVRERRKKFNDRFTDIRKINFRNSRCNLQLLRLPVSPLVNLNSIVPFKTVLNMREEIPFNPTPLLKHIGFRFKPIDPNKNWKYVATRDNSSNDSKDNLNFYVPGNRKYERFCEPYPMDRLLEIMDARSCGYYSRMATQFKITGESDEMPTPMMGQIVPPGGSVGKGLGFGLGKKKEPKKKPVPLSELKSFEKDKTIAKFEKMFPKSEDKEEFRIPLDRAIKDEKIREIIEESFPQDVVEYSGEVVIELPYLDDVCDEGDIFRNPRYLGEYRYKYWFHPFYGSPALPSDAKKIIEEFNKEHPDEQIDYEKEFMCDMIFCHSNGTIVELREDVVPKHPKDDDISMVGEDPREPRFVIYVDRNYIKEHNLKKGDIFEMVNEENRRLYFDNIFFQPKSFRHPVYLPDGSLFHENFIPKQRR